MWRVAWCPECGRLVGVVQEAQAQVRAPRYRLVPHASTVLPATRKARRPRCVPGTGRPVGPHEMWETAMSPEQRRREEREEARAAREAAPSAPA